jgi:hypothetical protein
MASTEQKKSYEVVKNFKGVNTKANRTAIDKEEFSWLENAMPIGYANLKIVPTFTTANVSFANTVTTLASCNINNSDLALGFSQNGRAEAINVTNYTKSNVAVTGTFSSSDIKVTQWKSERILIADPDKGVYSWDGTNLVTIGSVGSIAVTRPGSGYTSTPVVNISAPNEVGGVQATAQATVTANAVTAITLTEAGSGYTSPPTVTIFGGGSSNAANAVCSFVTFRKGTVSVNVTNGGTGYTNVSNTVVTITGGGGTNAAGTAILAGGQVIRVVMTNPGINYTNNANITVTITGGGGNNAAAKAVIQTEQVSGIQTFSGRTWVSQGRTVYYSAADSYSDFTSVSAGNLVLTDNTLHSNIVQLLAANNFLYIFGEDSINVFSDVRVTTTGTTIFTNTNVSASVGTRLPYAIFPFFRSVLFMNEYGAYALVGSTTSKISDALDGVFPDIDFTTAEITGGQVLINNILCAAFNIRYNDNGTYQYIQAVFFDKKWFFTKQNPDLKLITSIPTNGKINMYGTTGTDLVFLYSDSTSLIDSVIETALMPMTDPIRTKQALKIGIEATISGAGLLSTTIDSESNSSPPYLLGNYVVWTNNFGSPVPWINNSSTAIQWLSTSGYVLYKTDAQQWGKYLGMTVTSNSSAMVINGFEYEHELRVRF